MIVSRRCRRALLVGAGLFALEALIPANADDSNVAVAARVGTPGYGLELGAGFAEHFAARLGYSFLDYNRSITDTDVRYDGKLKINDASALLDWYVLGGGFHFTVGATSGGIRLDATGKPTRGTYELNGTTYTAADVGSIGGRLKFGNSVAPYVGLGWGNPFGKAGHLSFLLDLGAIYGGDPDVTLTATCGPAAPEGTPVCTRLKEDTAAERHRLESDVTLARWYPVASLGLAWRF